MNLYEVHHAKNPGLDPEIDFVVSESVPAVLAMFDRIYGHRDIQAVIRHQTVMVDGTVTPVSMREMVEP